MSKQTVVFDFDGVIHGYTSGWVDIDVIPDPPVEGIKELIQKLRGNGYKVVVVSTRCMSPDGQVAILNWLDKYNIFVDRVTDVKPPAIAYVDDRAYRFRGPMDSHEVDYVYDEITNLIPWNK